MAQRIILDDTHFKLTIDRLCHQLIENHRDFSGSCIIGIQPRGVYLADRIYKQLKKNVTGFKAAYGKLDITFYRDDFRQKGKPILADETDISFSVENKRVILIDDVLYTGRTIRSALDALLDYGRPEDVELLVLIDRRLHRTVPIQAKYIGKQVDSIISERVKVQWKEQGNNDMVWIVPEKASK